MTLLYFIFSKLTYKRFLLFWAFLGMLFTHSWLTEPKTPNIWHIIATLGFLGCGSIAVFCLITSFVFNNFKLNFKVTSHVIGMLLYLTMAICSSLINTFTIELIPILQLFIPIFFAVSFIYLFSEHDLKKVLIAITLFGLLNLFFTFFLNLKYSQETIFPLSGFITDRNGFAKYLSIINSFILIEFILQKNLQKRILLGLLLFVIFFGISILYSRSGYIVYLLSTSIVILIIISKSLKRFYFIFFPVIIIIFSIFTLNRIHAEKMMVANLSDIGRVYVGKAGINMIKAHPIKGVGYRMSEPQIQKYANRKFPGLPDLITIHNWYIVVWAEMGIVGFLIFLFLNLSLLYNCFKKVRNVGFVNGKYALFSLAALAIFIFDAQVLPNYDYESIYWIIVAVSIISLKKNVKQSLNFNSLKTVQ